MPMVSTMRLVMNEHFPEGFPEVLVATILKEVIKGICYIHDNHMIHNDIKADNILVDSNGDVRISGFRQLRVLQQGGTVKKSICSLVGDNIEWAAPEIVSQNARYTQSADIYSLGITAMELAYNKTPFDDWPPLKVLLCKRQYDCPAVSSSKSMSRNFYKFVSACVQKNPEARPNIHYCLDHPFLKQAKGNSYVEQLIIRKIESLNN